MNNDNNSKIDIYKNLIINNEITETYKFLIKYIMEIKAAFSKKYGKKYNTGNISPGYMDFTYFPFSDDSLKTKMLRFGIVLNHKEMQFELWLMGQNASVQKEYWNKLKNSKWNSDKAEMPKYSVLEVMLIEHPDFNNTDDLTELIIDKAGLFTKEIMKYLEELY